ncbi:MerR family transcriptional regulator [Natronospora cellulosivora (SeqCode)]
MTIDKDIPMRVVKEKTGLTSRQIRYYDQMNLIFPFRTKGNQRLFSENDIKRLSKIKSLLEEGYSIEAIKNKLKSPQPLKGKKIKMQSDILQNRPNKGDLVSRFPEINNYKIKNN